MAYDKQMDTGHISANLEAYEAARSAFFEFYVAPDQLKNLYNINFNRDSGQEATIQNKQIYNTDKAAEALRLNVTKAFVPNHKVGVTDYRRGNNVVHFAGVPEFSQGSITVDDVVGLDTKSLLYSWFYLAYDPQTFKGGRMSEYKKTATLTEYTQDFVPLRRWTLYGVFITEVSEGEFDRENDGKRQLTVQLSYDRAVQEVLDQEVSRTKYWGN